MRSGSTIVRQATEVPATVDLGRSCCGDFGISGRREWLVTNGLGGFASGTVAGVQTRRYHGLLVAALKPPVGRTLLVAQLDETVEYDGRTYPLATTRWHDGTLAPEGYRYLERFRLEGTVAVWTFACADAVVEKRLWMEQGANTTYVSYRLTRATRPVSLNLQAMVNYRDFHAATHAGDWRMSIETLADGVRIVPFDGAVPFSVRSDRAAVTGSHKWYRNYDLAEERARGLDDSEDHLRAASFAVTLESGESVTFVASTDPDASVDGEAALVRRRAHERDVLDTFVNDAPGNAQAPPWVAQLVLAADQFIVRRPLANDPEALSIIAGYHWFGDWGRDTMISLPGLTLATGRPSIAAKILETFSHYVDRGMLPNFFPDAGEKPEYNDVDASLWFIEAVRQYVEATNDVQFLRRLYPSLVQIVTCYREGTRYGIHCDPGDGLIWAGEPGVQLTWMDAKVGDWVVTPRIGKPAEVNALWYNALHSMIDFARRLGVSARDFEVPAAKARAGFARYWNEDTGYCFDVLDGPNGDDPSLRPNQLLAVSLLQSPLSPLQQRAVVDVCGRALLTSNGLRSLTADDPQFRPTYGGSQYERDGAYHQGTVWGWLIGPYVSAHLRVYEDLAAAYSVLEAVASHLDGFGLGTLPEIAGGAAPFPPNGCIAQAWTVAEVLRAWRILDASTRAR